MAQRGVNVNRFHVVLAVAAAIVSLAMVIYSSSRNSSLPGTPTVLGATDRPTSPFEAILELFHF